MIVDDGSTDGTESLITSLADSRIVYIKQSNQGQNAARNTGVEHASSTWLAFHDSDDQMLPHKLSTVFAKIRELEQTYGPCEERLAVFHPYTRVDEDTQSEPVIIPQALVTRFPDGFDNMRGSFDQMEILLGNFISSQTLVIGRKSLHDIGGWNESLRRYTDWELAIRIADSLKMSFINEPLVDVFVQPDSASHSVEQGHIARQSIFNMHRQLYRKNPAKYLRQWLRIKYRSLINR